MTVLERRATRVERVGVGFGSYLVVGLVALVLGMLAAYGLQRAASTPVLAPTEADRGAAVTTNLAGLWQSGLAQQAVIQEHHLLQGRIEAGLAQQQVMTQRYAVIQGRIESGLAQQAAIKAIHGFHDAWMMRGEAMTHFVDDLVTSGLAVRDSSFSDAWSQRGAEMSSHLEGLVKSGEAQQAVIAGN